MSRRPPHIRGALLTGQTAYLLHRGIDRDALLAELRRLGYGDPWLEDARAALDAIEHEARLYAKRAREAVQPAAVTGTAALPQRTESSSSPTVDEMTTPAAAEALGLGERRVRQLITAGELPARRIGGAWLLDRTAVLALVAARTGGQAGAVVASDDRSARTEPTTTRTSCPTT